MKVVIAMDSFKGSLSSLEAGHAAGRAVSEVCPDAEVVVLPVADGGEGTTKALITGLGGRMVEIEVHGPLGEKRRCHYGISASGTAVVEMAESSGLTLVPKEKRDPLVTSTYGFGEMILDAAGRGCRDFIVGIGGSATNDGGMGMLTALGVKFLDARGGLLRGSGSDLEKVKSIDTSGMAPVLSLCRFRVACDVDNPLTGPMGCARIFAPQKGASPETVERLDKGAESFADAVSAAFGRDQRNTPGAGAAGGLGYAFLSFLPAALEPGIDIVLEETRLEELLADADFAITGEGRMDAQSVLGKAPVGVARAAKKHGAAVIAFAGCVSDDAAVCNDYGIDGVFPILRAPCSAEEAMDRANAEKNLYAAAKQVFTMIKALKK